jgi:hypothetical protein
MAALARFRELVPPPAELDEPPVDWAAVEETLGMRLPADYKGYIDTYGVGSVNGLFWVRRAGTRHENVDLLTGTDDEPNLDLFLVPPPYPMGAGPDRLFQCAFSEADDELYWHTVGDPDAWPVVLTHSTGDAWLPYDMTLVEFLLALYTGELEDLGYAEAGYLESPLEFQPASPA